MDSELVIRAADEGDISSLVNVARATFVAANTVDNQVPQFVLDYVDDAFTAEKIATDIKNPKITWLLATDVDGPAGYVKLVADRAADCLSCERPAQLERIYVMPDRQGRGIGRQLLGATVRAAQAACAQALWLSVWEENRDAQRFYEASGFRRAGRATFDVGSERQHDFVLVLSL